MTVNIATIVTPAQTKNRFLLIPVSTFFNFIRLFIAIQDAGDRTQAPATRPLCTTVILHPDKI